MAAYNHLQEFGNRYQDAQFYTVKSMPQLIGYEIGIAYSKYGYVVAIKTFAKRGMVMTLQQSTKLTRANAAGTLTTLVEAGLGIIADKIDHPSARQGCQVIGKATGLVGQVYQGAVVGSLIGGGPVGMAVGGLIAGAVWCTCEVLATG